MNSLACGLRAIFARLRAEWPMVLAVAGVHLFVAAHFQSLLVLMPSLLLGFAVLTRAAPVTPASSGKKGDFPILLYYGEGSERVETPIGAHGAMLLTRIGEKEVRVHTVGSKGHTDVHQMVEDAHLYLLNRVSASFPEPASPTRH